MSRLQLTLLAALLSPMKALVSLRTMPTSTPPARLPCRATSVFMWSSWVILQEVMPGPVLFSWETTMMP